MRFLRQIQVHNLRQLQDMIISQIRRNTIPHTLLRNKSNFLFLQSLFIQIVSFLLNFQLLSLNIPFLVQPLQVIRLLKQHLPILNKHTINLNHSAPKPILLKFTKFFQISLFNLINPFLFLLLLLSHFHFSQLSNSLLLILSQLVQFPQIYSTALI